MRRVKCDHIKRLITLTSDNIKRLSLQIKSYHLTNFDLLDIIQLIKTLKSENINLDQIRRPLLNLYFFIQQGIINVVASKLQTIARFKGIKQMWIGADFSNTSSAWQWRGYYKSFNGNSIQLLVRLSQYNFELDFYF